MKYIAGGAEIRLGKKLGGRGEGEVFAVVESVAGGKRLLAAKIFKPDKRDGLRQRKVELLCEKDADGALAFSDNFAWPIAPVYEVTGGSKQFCGYLMQRVKNGKELSMLFDPAKRDKSWKYYITVAENIATCFYEIHKLNVVIGDVNPGNILVQAGGAIKLIDLDSISVFDDDGTLLPCTVGQPPYMAPELHVDITAMSKHSDNFALAVIIYELLMEGVHPFYCDEFPDLGECIAKKQVPLFESAGVTLTFSKWAPSLSSLPGGLVELFRQAFVGGLSDPSKRPGSYLWFQALDVLRKSLVACGHNRAHEYWSGAGYCPWCELETKASGGRRLAPARASAIGSKEPQSANPSGTSVVGSGFGRFNIPSQQLQAKAKGWWGQIQSRWNKATLRNKVAVVALAAITVFVIGCTLGSIKNPVNSSSQSISSSVSLPTAAGNATNSTASSSSGSEGQKATENTSASTPSSSIIKPGDSYQDAAEISVGALVTGHLSDTFENVTNWYKFTTQTSGKAQVKLKTPQLNSADYYWDIYVYASTDLNKQRTPAEEARAGLDAVQGINPLDSVKPLAHQYVAGKQTETTLAFNVTAGVTYYARIESSNQYSGSDYTIIVQR